MNISNWSELIWSGAIIGIASIAVMILGGVLAAIVFVKLPSTYFCEHHDREFWTDKHPVVRWIGRAIKNLLGVLLIVLGVLLSLPAIPGPGMLTIIIGITMLDFPGKRRLERWVVGRPAIFNAINRLRQRHGKLPIVLEISSYTTKNHE
jgi:hypothetical protein